MEKFSVFAFLLQLLLLALISSWPGALGTPEMTATINNTLFLGVGDLDLNSNKMYAHFRGIRYGQAPVGNRRFQKSAMYIYENGVESAKKYGNVCPQVREDNPQIIAFDVIDEDCLFLNIMVPLDDRNVLANADSDDAFEMSSLLDAKKAVYIFIHGGAFMKGSGNLYASGEFATRGDVIVVTLNYRLGIFGFLSTDDGVMTSNLGLWDQQLAIQWVKTNIEAFGGDSSRITVGGQLAGSASAILQAFYGGNDGLFQNVIAQSGSPMAMQVVSEKGLSVALEVAEIAGCNPLTKTGFNENEIPLSSTEIIRCLRGISTTDLLYHNPIKRIGPVLDNEFITRNTFELCPQGIRRFAIPDSTISPAFAKKNILIGFNENDGAIAFHHLTSKMAEKFRLPPQYFALQQQSSNVTQLILYSMQKLDSKEIFEAVIAKYRDDSSTPGSPPRVNNIEMMTDVYFASPGINTAVIHSMANSKACDSDVDDGGDGGLNTNSSTTNCDNHPKGRTYLYDFHNHAKQPNQQHASSSAQRQQLHKLPILPAKTDFTVNAWSNFIKTGNPNAEGFNEWKEYSVESRLMCELSELPHHQHVTNNAIERAQFWNEDLPRTKERAEFSLVKRSLDRKKREILCAKGGAGSIVTLSRGTNVSVLSKLNACKLYLVLFVLSSIGISYFTY